MQWFTITRIYVNDGIREQVSIDLDEIGLLCQRVMCNYLYTIDEIICLMKLYCIFQATHATNIDATVL